MGFLIVLLVLLPQAAVTPAPVAIEVEARALQPGELVVLDISTTSPADGVTVRAFDRAVPVARRDPNRWQAFLGIDLDVAPGRYAVQVEVAHGEARDRATQALDVVAKAFRTRQLTVDNAFVNPPAAVQKRIADEAAELSRIWRDSAPEPLWRGPFVRPVPQKANSAFGSRSIFNGQPRNPHGGADFLSPAGTPVKAPGGGRVVLARDLYYTGNSVVIDHGMGLVSLFAHLSAIDVEPGQTVSAGQVVGQVGATGRVTGAHLHWTLRADGARIDPLSLLAVLGAR
ncbi:MAG: peptidoglycan DD-metalloendopeptidase family protein [Vicinamibacterales bacterium]